MEPKRRNSLAFGVVLILFGLVFLAIKMIPGLSNFLKVDYSWPWIVIGVGVFLLIFGLLAGAPGMAVPACIVGGVGGILYWQNITGRWDTWSFIWALIPGFVGLGLIVSALIGGERGSFGPGLRLVSISVILFLVFGSFLGGLDLLGPYWPVLLILAGLFILLRPFFARKKP